MPMLSSRRFRFGRLPCDPPPRLWGPILLWQLMCWPVAALGNDIRRSAAGVQWSRALIERAAIAVMVVGGVLIAVHIL